MDDINKMTFSDLLHSTSKVALGYVPGAGPILQEIFTLLISAPVEKRRDEWMTNVTQKLVELEAGKKIDFSALQEDEIFIDTLIQATSFALKTSQIEKREYLKNAIINVALHEAVDISKITVFLSAIDRFTIWHIRTLEYIDNPTQWLQKNNQTLRITMGNLLTVFATIFPELKDQQEFMELIWNDLKNSGFHNSSISTTMSQSGLLQNSTSNLGSEFLEFIRE